MRGDIHLIFPARDRLGGGQIQYMTTSATGGPCDLQFDVKSA